MEHDVILRTPNFLGGGAAPAVLRRTDQRFVEGLFRDLKTDDGHQDLRTQKIGMKRDDDDMVLYQPVHRTFSLVVVEAVCRAPGYPRVDPRKIESAGLVMRRRVPVAMVGEKPRKGKPIQYERPERWVSRDESIVGWMPTLNAHDELEDPDPRYRLPIRDGNPVIQRALAHRRQQQVGPLAETVIKLYPVPPDICEALGSTLFFGVVSTDEPEVRDTTVALKGNASPPLASNTPKVDETMARSTLPAWLRERSTAATVPAQLAGFKFRSRNRGSKDVLDLVIERLEDGHWREFTFPDPFIPAADPNSSDATLQDLRHFIRMIWQVRIELDVLAPNPKPEMKALRDIFDTLQLTLPDGSHTKLGAWFSAVSNVFIAMDEGAQVQFPRTWPVISKNTAQQINTGVMNAMNAQLRKFLRHEGKFDRHDARYQLRAFVRVHCDDDCPPEIRWTDATADLRIARWYEGGPEGAVVPSIELPSIDRGFLKNLRPNVTVKVPRSLFNFLMNNAPKDFLDGKAKNDVSGPAFQWICGFNISIIFIIAFMLLITFVLLLNIVFWWIFIFRICIPFPSTSFNPDED